MAAAAGRTAWRRGSVWSWVNRNLLVITFRGFQDELLLKKPHVLPRMYKCALAICECYKAKVLRSGLAAPYHGHHSNSVS